MTTDDQCFCVGFTSLLSHSSDTFQQQMTDEETQMGRNYKSQKTNTICKSFLSLKMIVVKNLRFTERQWKEKTMKKVSYVRCV